MLISNSVFDTVNSAFISSILASKPHFIVELEDQEYPGLETTIECAVVVGGIPEPSLEWYYSDSGDDDYKRLDVNDSKICKVRNEGEGKYVLELFNSQNGYVKCVATNSEGSDECKAELVWVEKGKKIRFF